jgi:predicted RNA-binding protein with PUA-like domain
MNWLFKEEPSHYSYAALVRDGGARWSGVKNALAQKHLKTVRRGDRILYYHTGGEKAVVGVARATSDAHPDPEDRAGRLSAVEIAPVRALPRPVSLAEIKANRLFATSPLVRIPRLSVMPVTDRQWAAIERLAGR